MGRTTKYVEPFGRSYYSRLTFSTFFSIINKVKRNFDAVQSLGAGNTATRPHGTTTRHTGLPLTLLQLLLQVRPAVGPDVLGPIAGGNSGGGNMHSSSSIISISSSRRK